ncbi:TetR/AcrR family transcriptional regulator [Chachezhania sediminis]|uniref:TetR/AcrR family transcriptional regulator n=1 Tax=Chachezhania sediminis TaxID=2599291 RepID=UPI00131EB6D5|nr:TetR/AcrR family transcriptional regulator [Chachezhania sediminis]
MRVSRDVAEGNRKRVVETASRLFREQGYDGIGISGLMKVAGLTHGGFYKQFADKQALVVEATRAALAENLRRWSKVMARNGKDPVRAFRDFYVSRAHVDDPADGCSLATLAAEAARQGPEVQSAFAGGIGAMAGQLQLAGLDRDAALHQLSTMVGAVILARAVGEDPLADEILNAARTDEGSGR